MLLRVSLRRHLSLPLAEETQPLAAPIKRRKDNKASCVWAGRKMGGFAGVMFITIS